MIPLIVAAGFLVVLLVVAEARLERRRAPRSFEVPLGHKRVGIR